MDKIDCVVIGAGIIGLAVARELALAGHEVIIIESENVIGSVTSSRNSEVIHAGIYYPSNSLKAKLCVSGREMLYDYCNSRQVSYRRCEKLIVATNPLQIEKLKLIHTQAIANGVEDLQLLTREEALSLEPEIHCVAALLSPSTGIIDSHALMQSFLADAEAHGAILALQSKVACGEITSKGIFLEIETIDGERTAVHADVIVNAAGLCAPAIAACLAGFPPETIPRAYYAKGNYYNLAMRAPFSRLIYPVPEPGGLGVHLTLDLGGQAKFGPDVEWLDISVADKIDYAVEPKRADKFYAEVRKYWPGLTDNSLRPAYAGVRPKIAPPGIDSDFLMQGPRQHGVKGLVNLFGIESPGLTSSLAIAKNVYALLNT